MKIVANVEYVRLKQIGVGQGMNSEVYLADDPQLGGKVAVKEIEKRRLGNAVNAFFREAKTMFSATHENVVPVRWAGATADRVCIAMPYYAAGSLLTRIETHPIRISEVVRVGDAVLTGLAQVHTAGFIHFDLKPSNVLFGRRDVPLLADFGQSREIGPGGVVTVPPLYFIMMPPECMAGGVGSVQSDIYQAGILLYRSANGDPFFHAQVPPTDQEIEAQTQSGEFPDRDTFLPHVPLKLRQVIRKALSLDPQDRYQSATEMADDLGRVSTSLDWEMARSGTKTTWSAIRSPAPGYSVEMIDTASGREVQVFTVSSQGKRAKGKTDLWASGLKPKRALTHLRKVFRVLAG